MVQDYKLLMKTAILAGETLLSSGAETYRVEDTMKRILNVSGLETVKFAGAISLGIFVTETVFRLIAQGKRIEKKVNLG